MSIIPDIMIVLVVILYLLKINLSEDFRPRKAVISLAWNRYILNNSCLIFLLLFAFNRNYLTVLYHQITGTSWKCYFTVPWKMVKFKILMTLPLVRAPRYKNFDESFLMASQQSVKLCWILHCSTTYSAGLSWSNIQILWTW